MSLLMPPPQNNYEAIQAAAERIANYASSIAEAHTLGHGPGALDEIWTREYQEKAIQVYQLTLPWNYQATLAANFHATAREMTVAATPAHVASEWYIINEYLRTASEVIFSYLPTDTEITADQPIAPRTPGVMQFSLLAEIASADAAAELEAAGTAVRSALQTKPQDGHTPNPLTREQTCLLQFLAAGHKIVDIGADLGYSTRSIQRKLTDIRTQLNVETNHEVLALAVKQGWLDPDH